VASNSSRISAARSFAWPDDLEGLLRDAGRQREDHHRGEARGREEEGREQDATGEDEGVRHERVSLSARCAGPGTAALM
jgi:hypothetical protein